MASLYAASEVGVLVSEREALGASAVEAMAVASPLVTRGVEGLQEVAEDGVSGILLDDEAPQGAGCRADYPPPGPRPKNEHGCCRARSRPTL